MSTNLSLKKKFIDVQGSHMSVRKNQTSIPPHTFNKVCGINTPSKQQKIHKKLPKILVSCLELNVKALSQHLRPMNHYQNKGHPTPLMR